MIKTSQFIWLKLKVEYFTNIFIEIKKLLWDKEKEILEFQNPLSLHITVYYLPWKTTEIEEKEIKDIIEKFSQQKIKISMKKLEYFWKKIAYISYDNFENLEKIQKSDFIENFHLYAINSTFTPELQVITY